MGKAEGVGDNWHGHVTALSVAPEFRRLGVAGKLMHNLEQASERSTLCLSHGVLSSYKGGSSNSF